ncbi:hypothetical protein LCGC14_2953740, partial [marine sediment metagenome]
LRVFTHRGRPQKVLNVIHHKGHTEVMVLALDNGQEIRITDQHPVLTVGRGWVPAGELTTEDVLHHLISPSRRRWKLADAHPKNWMFKGSSAHLKNRNNEPMRESGRKVGLSRLGALVTAAQRKGRTWLEVYGHPRPNYGGGAGENHPNWKGGRPRRGYNWDWDTVRADIIARDGVCVHCGAEESPTRGLSVHHIDENRQNDSPDNLITLCDSDHSRVGRGTLTLANGVKIVRIDKEFYSGEVYNLDVAEDYTYAGDGIVYHNSNVQVGQVLSEWTHPDTGKVYKTQVDEIGLFCVIKIRTDKFRPKIVDKVIEDIEKGNLKAFSISGDAPLASREHKCDGGECFWVIPAIEFYEITICEEGVNQGAKLMILAKS